MKLLYIVSHAYPHSSNGYAVRTHGIAKALAAAGVSITVITKPGRPWDLPDFEAYDFSLEHLIDGVRYICVPQPSKKLLKNTNRNWVDAAEQELLNMYAIFRPDVVMAASNWENALPALKASKSFGTPFYYEVRGFWEYSKASRISGYDQTEEFSKWYMAEVAVANAADRVYTLTSQMRKELVTRGVSVQNINLLPNGVDEVVAVREQSIASTSDLDRPVKIGYVGSFSIYEGLKDLISAVAALKESFNVELILVGSSRETTKASGACEMTEDLRIHAASLGADNCVNFVGRVGPAELHAYYDAIDVIVIPRKPYKVCEIVSPIKPLEAAAYGKAIVVSNVAPLRDMAVDGGFLYYDKHRTSSLVSVLETLCLNRKLCQNIGQSAQRWVSEHRQFKTIVEQLLVDLRTDSGTRA